MKIISAEQVNAVLKYPDLIDILKNAYGGSFNMPPRKVFLLDEESGSHDAFALLPSWNDKVIGVKAFTYFPHNKLPNKSLYSKILLFDRQYGAPLALVDGTIVTFWRTAGISALASKFLSRRDSKTLFLLGTGNLATYLIKAHASVRDLESVIVWGRSKEKAESVIHNMAQELPALAFSVTESIAAGCQKADIIVSATGSPDILVQGEWVKEGTHTDFLGNHHADKRECDTNLILKSNVYVDTRVNCFKEAGEILVPIEEGVFSKEDVKGELAELCSGKAPLRANTQEITLFKSVGSALSDLVTAHFAYRSIED